MTRTSEIRIPANEIAIRRATESSIAVVGNPNSGKSTLFNRLTGLKQRIGNYPGVTVERHVGILSFDGKQTELVDLPGTHSLSAHSLEEQIAVDVILGRIEGSDSPDGILAVLECDQFVSGIIPDTATDRLAIAISDRPYDDGCRGTVRNRHRC